MKALACCLQMSLFLFFIFCSRVPVHIAPQYCCSSSLHLPRFLFPPIDVQTVSATLHLLSVLRLMCLAHIHFLFLIISLLSITLVGPSPNCSFLGLYKMLCCAADNFFSIFVVNVQVSAPYVIAGRMHWFKTFLFKHVGSVPFIIMLCRTSVV